LTGVGLERTGAGLFDLACVPIAPSNASHGGVRVGRDEQIHGGQALVVHALAIVDGVIERHLDHGCGRSTAHGLERAGEIKPIEAS